MDLFLFQVLDGRVDIVDAVVEPVPVPGEHLLVAEHLDVVLEVADEHHEVCRTADGGAAGLEVGDLGGERAIGEGFALRGRHVDTII